MDQLLHSIVQIPPFTRYWCLSLLLTSIATHIKLISHVSFIFKPDKLLTQPYRPLLSLIYMEDFSLHLLFNIYILSQSSRAYEDNYSITHLLPRHRLIDDRYKSWDFFYHIFQISVLIIIAFSCGYFFLDYKSPNLSNVLSQIILYLHCRSSLHQLVNVFGLITLRRVYLPWFNIFFTLLFNRQILSEVYLIIFGDFSRLLPLLKIDYFYRFYLVILLSHFWWFISELLISNIYTIKNDKARKLRQHTLANYGVSHSYWLKGVLLAMLIPPWYIPIIKKINRLPDPELEPEVDNEVGPEQGTLDVNFAAESANPELGTGDELGADLVGNIHPTTSGNVLGTRNGHDTWIRRNENVSDGSSGNVLGTRVDTNENELFGNSSGIHQNKSLSGDVDVEVIPSSSLGNTASGVSMNQNNESFPVNRNVLKPVENGDDEENTGGHVD